MPMATLTSSIVVPPVSLLLASLKPSNPTQPTQVRATLTRQPGMNWENWLASHTPSQDLPHDSVRARLEKLGKERERKKPKEKERELDNLVRERERERDSSLTHQ
jgi:hypothetical protein